MSIASKWAAEWKVANDAYDSIKKEEPNWVLNDSEKEKSLKNSSINQGCINMEGQLCLTGMYHIPYEKTCLLIEWMHNTFSRFNNKPSVAEEWAKKQKLAYETRQLIESQRPMWFKDPNEKHRHTCKAHAYVDDRGEIKTEWASLPEDRAKDLSKWISEVCA